ncbi:Antirestriction ArdA family protein [Actinobacteria bacterium OV320]|nr:Antirestriction ArdA family protein [Actinobacteria bacterium OV320]
MIQIYVACLASYNAGVLHGEWIDASQNENSIDHAIELMLEKSPIQGAENWAIHDYDGMVDLGEYASIETVVATAELIEEHGYFVTAYVMGEEGNDPDSAKERIEDRYLGKYETELFGGEVDALMAYYEQSEQYDQSELPEWARPHYDAIMRDKAEDDLSGGEFHLEFESVGVYHIFSN